MKPFQSFPIGVLPKDISSLSMLIGEPKDLLSFLGKLQNFELELPNINESLTFITSYPHKPEKSVTDINMYIDCVLKSLQKTTQL